MTILGCRVDAVDMDATLRRIEHYLAEGGPHQIVTLGTEMVVYAQRDASYRDIVNACALAVCDTAGLLWASRLRSGPLRARVAGVELVERLCEMSVRTGARLFFLGGAPGIAAQAAHALAARYQGMRVAGALDGYFSPEGSAEIAAAIAVARADIVFVGLGFPRQEVWLTNHLAATGARVGIGVGGSFDILSGHKQRAPHVWCKMHLEWLYRLLDEPSRWRRQLALPVFAWLALREQLTLIFRARTARRSSRGSHQGE